MGGGAIPLLKERAVTLSVNGAEHTLLVEPRTHLADGLREQLNLTGTQLGCEQGVCGACTVPIDGVPQRSCIAYAVDCKGSRITTIEGLWRGTRFARRRPRQWPRDARARANQGELRSSRARLA